MVKDYISIIVPVYNCEKHIVECVNSIEESDYKSFEIILVNDGSTDDSEQKCRILAEKFDNIKYFSQKNSGVSVARNLGLQHAMGEYISFVDGDDLIKPNMLSELIGMMNDDTDIACCSYYILEGEKESSQFFFKNSFSATTPQEKNTFFMQLLDESYGRDGEIYSTAIGVPWGKLYRSSFLKDIRFDENLRRMQDNVFNMYAFDKARTISYKNVPLYVYRIEHVMDYIKSVKLVNPKILERISILRSSFFNSHPEYFNDELKKALLTDNISFFASCMQYYVIINKDKKSACNDIKEFCKTSNISKVIKSSSAKISSRSYRILSILCKSNSASLLYRLYVYITRNTR